MDVGYDMLHLAEMKESRSSSELLKKLGLKLENISAFKRSVQNAHNSALQRESVQGLKEKLIGHPDEVPEKVKKSLEEDNFGPEHFLLAFEKSHEKLFEFSSRRVQKLCRRQVEQEGILVRQNNLKCRYSTGTTDTSVETAETTASAMLAPLKLEDLNRGPDITVIRQLMTGPECDSIVQSLPADLFNLPGKERKNKEWSIKNTWIYENATWPVKELVRRIELVTGLRARAMPDSPEEFRRIMCGNYGVGGNYGLHPDFYDNAASGIDTSGDEASTAAADNHKDNRGVTVMSVLSSPDLGGATVWPFLNVAAKLNKGDALMWYNLGEDGEPLVLTHHSACPVIRGDKWIANKWLSQAAQWNTRKCPVQ